MTREDTGGAARGVSPSPPGPTWAAVAGVVAFTLIVGAAVALAVTQYRDRVHDQAEVALTAAVEDAARRMDTWVEQGFRDVAVSGAQSGIGDRYMRYLAGSDDLFPKTIASRLEAERTVRGYHTVQMRDRSGGFAFGNRDAEGSLEPCVACNDGATPTAASLARESIATGSPVFTDGIGISETGWHVAWAGPLISSATSAPVGAVVYTADLVEAVRVTLSGLPMAYSTGTIAALRKVGDGYRVIGGAAEFSLQEVPDAGGLHEQLAVETTHGRTIVRTGVDARGVPLIAAARRLGPTDWFIAARIDRAELDADVREYAQLLGAIGALGVAVVALGTLLTRRLVLARYRDHQAYLQVQGALAVREQFLANMSHELRTPLNSVIGFSAILSKGMAGPVNDEQKRQLGMIDSAAQRLLALVDDLLDLSKLRVQEPVLEIEPVDIAAIVAFVGDLMSPLGEVKGLKQEYTVRTAVTSIDTDRHALERILLNLLSNAIKFTDAGSVTLSVTGDDDVVVFTVRDTGRGIPADQLHAVMEDFHQVVEPAGVKPVGTGLGLAISRRMAEALGGTLTVESVYGEGSTFTLTVPREAPEA